MWEAAHGFARQGAWAVGRCFRFLNDAAGGNENQDSKMGHDIALTDPDARVWAAAADARSGLHTRYGLSLGLRLLALVDLLARSRPAQGLVTLKAGEAELHPALVAAAARAPLTAQARFDAPTLLAGLPAACEALPTNRPETGPS